MSKGCKEIGGQDHLEAIRGRLRELEAVFESFCLNKVWGTKSFGMKNVKRLLRNFRGLDNQEAIRGRSGELEAV